MDSTQTPRELVRGRLRAGSADRIAVPKQTWIALGPSAALLLDEFMYFDENREDRSEPMVKTLDEFTRYAGEALPARTRGRALQKLRDAGLITTHSRGALGTEVVIHWAMIEVLTRPPARNDRPHRLNGSATSADRGGDDRPHRPNGSATSADRTIYRPDKPEQHPLPSPSTPPDHGQPGGEDSPSADAAGGGEASPWEQVYAFIGELYGERAHRKGQPGSSLAWSGAIVRVLADGHEGQDGADRVETLLRAYQASEGGFKYAPSQPNLRAGHIHRWLGKSDGKRALRRVDAAPVDLSQVEWGKR